MQLGDEVDGDARAGWAADRDPDGLPARPRSEQEERRRKNRPGPLFRVAEEAPRPLPRLDPPRREICKLMAHVVEMRRHQVEEDAVLEPQRRPVELVVGDEPRMLA